MWISRLLNSILMLSALKSVTTTCSMIVTYEPHC
ncbi:MAG: hypothetical protein DRO87_11675 [Candidatus Thorarchaeota archaeon]|nr:MAG: hypothetical protein DRO87_11675 [Candidatus Thorarchaeota archaeon]RLI57648.1 MAG: hypothetical protein DRP09_02445 [Candidatus Thorarchaeota archaeon]